MTDHYTKPPLAYSSSTLCPFKKSQGSSVNRVSHAMLRADLAAGDKWRTLETEHVVCVLE